MITAKIKFGILLCCLSMRFFMFSMLFLMLRIIFNVFSMMFAKTSLLFCWFRMVLCETSMLLFVSVLCYAKPRCYYSCLYGVMRNLDAIIHTPNANMADCSAVARDESHKSEASWALIFCFYNASSEKSCYVVDILCFILLCLRVAVSLNATRRGRNLPPFAS